MAQARTGVGVIRAENGLSSGEPSHPARIFETMPAEWSEEVGDGGLPLPAPRRVFAHLVAPLSDLYVALMDYALAQNRRYRMFFRIDDLADWPENREDLAQALQKLAGWGNLREEFDAETPRPTLVDYYHGSYRYAITLEGRRVHETVESLDALGISTPGQLRGELMVPIDEILGNLLEIDDYRADGEILGLLLDDLEAKVASLQSEANAYLSNISSSTGDLAADTDRFVEFREALTAYIAGFMSALGETLPRIRARLDLLAPRFDEIATATADAVQAPDLDPEAAHARRVHLRLELLRGVDGWFRGIEGRPAAVSDLKVAMSEAIVRLVAALARITDRQSQHVSRAADLRVAASWIAAAPTDDDAARIFADLFGLHGARHATTSSPDETQDRWERWIDAAPAQVAVSLRERGEISRRGRTARVKPNRVAEAAAQDAVLERFRRQRDAAARFAGRTLTLDELGHLDAASFEVLLDALAVVEKDEGPGSTHRGDGIAGMLSVTVTTPSGQSPEVTVSCDEGTLRCPNYRLSFDSAALGEITEEVTRAAFGARR